MTDERLKEIIDNISCGRVVKMTEKESEEITWRYIQVPPSSRTIVLIIKHKENGTN